MCSEIWLKPSDTLFRGWLGELWILLVFLEGFGGQGGLLGWG